MSLTDNGGMFMPVAPANGNGSGFGGDGWWAILFLFAMFGNGGWGNNGGNLSADISRGFDTAAITNQLSGIQTAVNAGFASAEVAGCNRAMDALTASYNNQIASMNQNFALQQQFANCCCENRLAIANLTADLAREACADRQAVADGVQKILDMMCQEKIDAKNEKLLETQTQLNLANLAASQNAQTLQLEQYITQALAKTSTAG